MRADFINNSQKILLTAFHKMFKHSIIISMKTYPFECQIGLHTKIENSVKIETSHLYYIQLNSQNTGITTVSDEYDCIRFTLLTHWGRVTHICVSKLTIIGSDNGLSPGRRQAIIWINARILLIRHLGTNFNEISIEILTFAFIKTRLKVSPAKWRPFCLGLNVLSYSWNP